MTLDLYVDLRSQTLIQSHRNGGKFVVPRQYREQVIPLRVFYVSPNATGGAANPFTIQDSSGNTVVRVAIGGFDAPLAVASGFTYNSTDDCWEDGSLNLNTVELNTALDAASGGEMTSIFETEGTDGTTLIKTQDPVTLKRTVLTSSAGLPVDVTDLLFATYLEAALADSATVEWTRIGNTMSAEVVSNAANTDTDTVVWHGSPTMADAPLFGAPNIVPALHISFDVAFPPAVTSHTQTVLGVVGERYLVRARVVGVTEIAVYTGGYQKPGDDQRVYRGGDPTDPATDNLYIDISSPAQRIYLNAGPEAPATVIPVDFYVRFLVDGGATVTLAGDLMNAGSSGYPYADLTMVVAAESLETSAIAAHASTHASAGSDPVSLSKSQVAGLTLYNETSGTTSVVIGGSSSTSATIGGMVFGLSSTAVGDYSMATGYQANTRLRGQRAHAAGSNYGFTLSDYILNALTNDQFPLALLLDAQSNQRLTLPNNSTFAFKAMLTARRTDVSENDGWEIIGLIHRDANAASTTLDAVQINQIGSTSWGVAVTANTTSGDLRFTVTGEAGKNIRWGVNVTASEVTQ